MLLETCDFTMGALAWRGVAANVGHHSISGCRHASCDNTKRPTRLGMPDCLASHRLVLCQSVISGLGVWWLNAVKPQR